MPLIIAGKGYYKVNRIVSGTILKRRLAKIGIIEGKDIEILSDVSNGPTIVKVDNCRYCLGHNMAKKIMINVN